MEWNKPEVVKDEELRDFFPDLPPGPLENYREKASFDWRRMKLFYDNLAAIKVKHDVYKFMENHPLFQHSSTTLPLDEDRHINTKRMYALHNEQFFTLEKLVEEPRIYQAEMEALFMYSSSLAIKTSLNFRLFANSIRGNGRDHHFELIEATEKGRVGGCFALTEVSHGSNAKGMRTTATYCPLRHQFELHTADFEAAKFWVGNLGKTATHAIVYAMLISKGKNHGLHQFLVPIRDPKTLKPYPGVIVGDIGEKIGLNGLDNGFVMFNKYPLPKEMALDKLGGVNDEGDYQTPFRDPNKRFGAAMGVLSGGRVTIVSISTNYLQKAIVIAIRYSAVRRQFGPESSDEEIPVLEYQQQQIRLLPYLAATYAMRIFSNWFCHAHIVLSINNLMGMDVELSATKGMEMHALSSACKPIAGWLARDGIQNCREACGGHGYLRAAALGDIRNDNDANCTYEGENSLLLQQTSNWLLNVWSMRHHSHTDAPYSTRHRVDSPYGTLHFLDRADELLKQKCRWITVKEFIEPSNLVFAYKWLTAFLLNTTYEKVQKLKIEGRDNFQAKNDSQSYNAITLSVVYGENFILNLFYKSALEFHDAACRSVLLKMVALYGAFILEKHLATLYIGGFLTDSQGQLLRDGILYLCEQLKDEAVSLADSLAPPDACLNSVLGNADGQVYKHIENNVLTYPDALTRPAWWKDVVHWDTYVKSKL